MSGSNDLVVMMGALVAFLSASGAGAKWLITVIDARHASAALLQAEAREALSIRLHEEIKVLREEIMRMQEEKTLYMRRIYMLENFIHRQHGIDIPDMIGWPPL